LGKGVGNFRIVAATIKNEIETHPSLRKAQIASPETVSINRDALGMKGALSDAVLDSFDN
jgi:hypothetical protein